jgi:hypothetical protein
MKFWWFLLLAAAPAQAAEVPVFLPRQDVQIDYTLTAPGRPAQDLSLSYQAGAHLARVDDAAHGVSYLADLRGGQVEILLPMLHAVVQAPDMSQFAGMITSAGGAQFVRLAPGHYAGMGCETYLVTNEQGTGTACLTQDGEILHFRGHDEHGSVELTADAVRFGAVPAALFAVPEGYSQMQLPPGMLAQLLK